VTSDLAKRRRRANLSLRGLQHAWIPLSVTYLAWLSISGYELAGWGGALMMCLLGTGYPFIIVISLSTRDIKPLPEPREETPT
jgi:hypothetical protein